MTCFTAPRLPVWRWPARSMMTMAGAQAFDETKYPDWSGQWRKPQGIGNQLGPDQSRPGRAQQAPLAAEYQAIFEASLADQGRRRKEGDDPASPACRPACRA